MKFVEECINIENARIIFRNFSGKKSSYNREGDRNFNVIIPSEELAHKLAEDGWNIRCREPREEGDRPEFRLPVAVAFNYKPPKVILVTKRNNTVLNEDTIGILDQADIVNVDLTIRPYNWKMQNKDGSESFGVKAYLKTMYVTVEEDAYADKYARDEYPGEPPFDMN